MTKSALSLPAGDRNSILAEHVEAIRQLGKQVVANIIEMGRRLTACKDIVGARDFNIWIDKTFGWSERHARNLMYAYELAEAKSENFSDLDLPVSAIYLLAAPSTPEPVRDEIIERAKAGEALPVAEVKQAIRRAKGKVCKQPAPHQEAAAEKPMSASISYAVKVAEMREAEVAEAKQEAVAEIKREHEAAIERLRLAHADEIAHLKSEIVPDGPLTLQAAIEMLIHEAQHVVNFINVLPETAVYAAKDLDKVVDKLRILNKHMAPRRKAAKAKTSPPKPAEPEAKLDVGAGDDIPPFLERSKKEASGKDAMNEQSKEAFSDLVRLAPGAKLN